MAEYNGKKIIFSTHVHVQGTEDGTATAGDILAGKVAYSQEQRLVGTLNTLDNTILFGITNDNGTAKVGIRNLKDNDEALFEIGTANTAQTIQPSLTDTVIPAQSFNFQNITIKGVNKINLAALDNNFNAANIKRGVTIFGLEGTYDGE